jgi:hypothetical protein
MTIIPDGERVIDIFGAEERSWPSNLEMGWGIWLGDDKIWFGLSPSRPGGGVDGVSLQAGGVG